MIEGARGGIINMKGPITPDSLPEGSTIVRKVDVHRLAAEAAEAGRSEPVAKTVTLISLREGTYLLVPAGSDFKGADGDSIDEDGITAVKAHQTILSLFGKSAYLEPSLWASIVHTVDSGAKVVLEVGDQPLVSPQAAINGKFPIRIRG